MKQETMSSRSEDFELLPGIYIQQVPDDQTFSLDIFHLRWSVGPISLSLPTSSLTMLKLESNGKLRNVILANYHAIHDTRCKARKEEDILLPAIGSKQFQKSQLQSPLRLHSVLAPISEESNWSTENVFQKPILQVQRNLQLGGPQQTRVPFSGGEMMRELAAAKQSTLSPYRNRPPPNR
ncbi:hypothetical protein BDN71DRAFT_1498413 [Pleurotus eryngii]|uniref:Uncharacterized protein n=1 Tax=Pleurotus eryngii TaxID=5323 RepID=A0A9P5ZMW8_PLEER|nr:hypothetical protein BDN71DRAFT_1498413 [Pleurotus eryngii]